MPQEIGLKEFHPNNITAKMNKTTIDSKNIKMSPELQWEKPTQEWSFSGQIMLKIQGEMAIIF